MLLAAEPVVNPIAKDGSTATTISSNGDASVINISTGTLSGDKLTGYNAFDTFGVRALQTVNLKLPGGADNLVNVVKNGGVTVNGVLNSLKDNAIGGNVFFAVPGGFVVGAGGVVNVGSLSVSTPTGAWVDEFVAGGFDSTGTANLISGNIPVVEGGLISIRGQINAADSVSLRGGEVRVTGQGGQKAVIAAGGSFDDAGVFSRTVNIGDLPGGTGNIRLIATGADSAIIGVTGGELAAAGDLSLQATAKNEVALKGIENSHLRVAIANAATSAEAVVDGASVLSGGRSVTVGATAETRVNGAGAVAPEAGISPIDGAASLSLSNIRNTATARIGGDTSVSTGGALTVQARGLVDVETVADATVVTPTGAAASLALSFVDQRVSAEISGNATVANSSGVSVLADGKTIQATSAKASVEGGGQSAIGHMVDQIDGLDDGQKASLTSLLDGAAGSLGMPSSGPQVAGAVAFARTNHATTARIATSQGIASTGDVTVKTRSLANVETLASGKTNGGSTGVGAAVAISTGNAANRAELDSRVNAGGAVTVAATGEDIDPKAPSGGGDAVSDPDQSFSTKAYSGQGASGVGVAGALAIHNLSTETESVLTDGADVNASGLTVSAENITTHEAVADGKNEDGAVAGVGVGASVALNFAENTTRAELEDGSEAHISGNLTLSANSSNTTKTKAVSGAAGGVAVVPVLALTNTKDIAKAHIASGSGIVQTGGALNLSSVHRHTNDTVAEGMASGGSTAVGLAAAVALTDDSNSAVISRNVNAGSVTLNAESDVAVTSQGLASAAGAAADEEQTLSQKLAAFFGAKSQVKGEDPDPEGKKQTDAETSEGGVSIAAAVGVTDVDSVNEARIGKSVHVTSSGDVSLAAASQLDVAAIGDGSAAGDTAAIGAGVAVNVARQDGRAVIEEGARVSGSNLTLTSGPSEGGYSTSTFEARANAGAGGGGVSVSGAAAINVVDNTLEARADGILDVGGQIDITSNNSSRSVAQAGAVGEGKTAGIGASFASNRTVHKSLAVLGGTSTMMQRAGVNVSAYNYSAQTTDAVAGNASSDGDTSTLALDAAVALTSDQNETKALVESGAALATDALSVTAESRSTNLTQAGGNASGNVAVGACVAVGTNSSVTEAGVTRDIEAQGDVALSARSESDDRVLAEASAKGAKADRYNGDNSSASGKNLKKAKTGKGGIAVAAAVGVNTLSNKTLAGIAGGSRITTTGNAEVSASETSRFETVGSGAAVAEGAAGVGVGVAIAELDKEASATVGAGTTLNAGGTLTVSADAKRNGDGASDNLLAARAEAGAGAKSIGVAGSLALVNANNLTRAAVEAGEVRAGNTVVSATDTERLAARSGSTASSSRYMSGAAIGASFALVNAGSETRASVAGHLGTGDLTLAATRQKVGTDSPELNGLEGLSTEERETHRKAANHYTEAVAGGKSNGTFAGAGAFAVTTVTETTEAKVADGAVINSGGHVQVAAGNSLRTRSFVGATGDSNGVGVGVSSATTVMDATTGATVGTGADVTASGNLAVTAGFENDVAARAMSTGDGLQTGASGAVVVNVISNQTRATLGDNATLHAGGNLDARAEDRSSLTGVSGSEASGLNIGLGASVLVNTLLSETAVAVGKGAELEALANGAAREVATGEKNGSVLSKGVALMADAFQKVKGLVASGAKGGSASLAGSSSTTVVKTRTQVNVADGVSTTHAMGSADGADLRMVATDSTELALDAGSASAAGKGAFGAAADVVVFAKATSARVGSEERAGDQAAANLKAGGDIHVGAASHEAQASKSYGYSVAGTAGVAGTVTVTNMKNRTTAHIAKGVGLSAGKDLTVSALESADVDHFAGGAAGGGVAGIGASVSVMKVANTTTASSGAQVAMDAKNHLTVDAETREDLQSITAAGAGAGTVGIAGAVSVKTASSTTRAFVGDNARVNEAARGSSQDVTLSARHDLKVAGYGGSAAGAGVVGVGASADIATIRTTTTAGTGSGAILKADRNIAITAESEKEVSSFTVAAAGGGATGISGATSLVFVGEALSGDAKSAIGDGKTTSSVDSSLAGNNVSGEVENTEAQGALSETSGLSISSEVNSASAQLVTEASTGAGTSLAAGGELTLDASDKTHLDVTSGSLSGGVVGIGGAVAMARVNNETRALTGSSNTLSAGSDLRISASTANLNDEVSKVRAFAGAGGLVGVSGALASLDEANTTQAFTGEGNTITRAGTVTLSARENRDLKTEAAGGGAGALAGGAAIAETRRNSNVTAHLGAGSRVGLTDGTTVGDLHVTADSTGTANSKATSGAAALVGATGAAATTEVTGNVTAELQGSGSRDAASRIKVTGDAFVDATNEIHAGSEASGIAGGVGVAGTTKATTTIHATTTARLGRYVNLDAGGNARIAARTVIEAGSDNTGGLGGGLAAGGATATTNVSNTTLAEVGDDATLKAGGTATVEGITNITAGATSFLKSGAVVARNEVEANVTVNSSTKARVGARAVVEADTVNLTAKTERLMVSARATSKTVAADSTSVANAKVAVTSDADVDVEPGATVTGEKAIVIKALQQNMSVESFADSKIVGATGVVEAFARADADVNASVNLKDGANLYTSSLVVETSSTLADASYTKDADAEGKTLVRLVTRAVEVVSNVVSKIPFVGKLIKKVVKWVTKVFKEILHSSESARTEGTRIHGGSIVMDADVHLLGSANPELMIDENGQVTKQNAVSITRDTDGNIQVGDIVNDKIGKVKLSATDGTVEGEGTIYMKNTYDTVTVTNQSDKKISIGKIRVSGDPGGDPNVEVIATNSHDFTVKPESTSGCDVSISSEKTGDVVLTDLIDNEFGSVSLASHGGDVVTTGNGAVRATNLTVNAGGNIGSSGHAFDAVMRAGKVNATAGGDLNMVVMRQEGSADKVGDSWALKGMTQLETLVAGGDLSVELRDGTTRVVETTVTEKSQALDKPFGMTDEEWNALPEDEKVLKWNVYSYKETAYDAAASYDIGTLEGGGDVRVDANNHADFSARRIASSEGSVTVNVPNGSYAVDRVEAANGTATLNVKGDITDARSDGAWNVRANAFDMRSATAGIGEIDALEVIQTGSGGALAGKATAGGIQLTAVENDLALGGLSATGTIRVSGKGSLVDANGEAVNLTAAEVHLTSQTGAIQADTDTDKLTLAAATGIDVEETDGDLYLTRAVSNAGTVRLVAAGNLVDTDADDAVDVAGDRAELVAKNGHIGASDKRLRINTRQGAMAASGSVYVDADGSLALDGVTASDLVALTVAGNLTDHNGKTVNIAANRVVLNSGGSIGTDTDAGTVKVTAKDSVDLEETDGDLTLESVSAGGNIFLTARAGNLKAKDAAVDVKGAGVNLTASGSIGEAGNILNIDSNGVVNLTAGEQVHLRETNGTLKAGSLSAGKRIFLTADSIANDGNANTRISTHELVVESRGSVEADTAAASLDIALSGSGDLTLREKDSVTVNRIALADGRADVEAGGDLLAGSGPTHIKARSMNIRSHDGAIGTVDNRLALDSTGSVRLDAGTDVVVREESDLTLDSLAARIGRADVLVGNGNLSVASAVAPEMRLVVSTETGKVTVGEAKIRDAVVRGGVVQLNALHDGGQGPMTLDVETAGGKASQSVNLTLKSSPGVEITNLHAVNVDIRATSDDLLLSSARILKRGDIRNDFNHVITDNDNLTPQACTLQLYPEDKRFSAHVKKANDVTTTARAVHYDDNFITNEFSTENSMVRQAEKELAQAAAPASKPTGKAAKKQIAMGKVSAPAPTMTQPLSIPVGTPPVALGGESMGTGETLELVAP